MGYKGIYANQIIVTHDIPMIICAMVNTFQNLVYIYIYSMAISGT